MIELLESTMPYLFPFLFISMWIFVLTVLSVLGGWKRLAANYSTIEKFIGDKWHFQSMKLGPVYYHGCINIGANPDHLFLSVFPIFRIMHPPLKIPLNEVHGVECKGIIFRYVDLKIEKVNENIRILKKQADRISIASNHKWQYKKAHNSRMNRTENTA